MHYSVIIISDKSFNFENTLCINEHIEFIDDCHILYKEETISFDYLIYKKYYKEKNYFNQAVSYTDNYKCNFTYNGWYGRAYFK